MSEVKYGLPDDMTLQAVYDKVVMHLMTQGRPSRSVSLVHSKNGECLYRDPDGRACAVGCLISDDDYDSSFEGIGVGGILDKDAFHSPPFPDFYRTKDCMNLLRDLQVIHDNAPVTEDGMFATSHLRAHLRRVADRFELDSNSCFGIKETA